jgi:enoyl-CoA hydratase
MSAPEQASRPVTTSYDGAVAVVTIDRPERRNAVDSATALALALAIEAADADEAVSVLVLTGAGGAFCAGADLQALAAGDRVDDPDALSAEGRGPMGPTRLRTAKPVIAAIEGPAVAGGLELALWADLRVVASDATLGVYCRRFGVPLIDLGTVRLPRLIGHSRAMDLILTGRGIDGVEAERIGLANRVCPPGEALATAVALAHDLAALPQRCLRNDRLSALEQWDLSEDDAMRNEMARGLDTIGSGETLGGATRFAGGAGRHGAAASVIE